MDHWSNLNLNQTYGRISSSGTLPSNATTLTPFDLQQVIDQRGFSAANLGAGLANPLPAHGRFPSLTHVNYAGIPLFDTMSQLSSTFPIQTAYKPSIQTVYTIETQSQQQPTIMQPIQVSTQIKMSGNELNFASSGNIASTDSKSWNRNSFVQTPATTNPYSGLPNDVTRSFNIKNDVKEPPPAHSGNRPSTIQRAPFKPQASIGQLSTNNQTSNLIRTQIPIANVVTQRSSSDTMPPTAHLNNMQKITDVNLVQRLLLSGQQFCVDNSLDANVIKSFPAVLQQVSQICQAYATSKGPTMITSSSNTKINLPTYQSQQQQSNYNASLFASGQNSTLLSYAQAVADGTVASYDAVSSPENDCLNANNAYLSGMMLTSENGKIIQLQQAPIEIASNVDAVQAIADSTTKPKRGSRGGKTATKTTSQIAIIGDNQLVLLNDDSDKTKKGKGKKLTGGQQRMQDTNNTVNMLLTKGYCQGLIGSFGQFVPAFNTTEGGDIQYADASFIQQRPGETYQIIQTDNGTATTLDACSYGKIQQQDNSQQQVFLTNMYGNSFVNPSEILPIDETLGTFLAVDQDLHGEVIEYLNQQKIKLKEEKETRSADEEFCHLFPASSVTPTVLDVVSPAVVSTAPSKPAGFLDCFLSFVQGKKQETLASVSNVPILNKPVLPKYIPDPRPRRVEEPPKPNLDLTKECAGEQNPFVTNDATKNRTGPKIIYDSFGLVKRGRGRPRLRPDDPVTKRPKVERPNRQKQYAHKKNKGESDSDKEVASNLLDTDSDDDPAWKPASKKDMIYRKSVHLDMSGSDSEKKKKYESEGSAKSSSDRLDLPTIVTHHFQKGDFVIDKKDEDVDDGYVVWKIDSGRLLQKFEPVIRDGRLHHQATSTYSSWTESLQHNYSAISVKIINGGRGNELIEVVEKLRIRAPYIGQDKNTSLIKDSSFQDSFSIYMQIFVSQSLEPSFLSSLHNEPDSYYMNPLKCMTNLLEESKMRIQRYIKWSTDFERSVSKYHYYSIYETSGENIHCQATINEKILAVKMIKLFGPVYNESTMGIDEVLEESCAIKYMVGAKSAEILPIYHDVLHIKYNLFELCKKKAADVKTEWITEGHQILDACLQDSIWIHQMLEKFDEVIQKTYQATLTI